MRKYQVLIIFFPVFNNWQEKCKYTVVLYFIWARNTQYCPCLLIAKLINHRPGIQQANYVWSFQRATAPLSQRVATFAENSVNARYREELLEDMSERNLVIFVLLAVLSNIAAEGKRFLAGFRIRMSSELKVRDRFCGIHCRTSTRWIDHLSPSIGISRLKCQTYVLQNPK